MVSRLRGARGPAAGLPIGLQLAGSPFDETAVQQAAHAYERARLANTSGVRPSTNDSLTAPETPTSICRFGRRLHSSSAHVDGSQTMIEGFPYGS
jgi:hypothetical protein